MVLAMDDAVPRRLDWEREELILAGDLVARNSWRQIAATDPRVIELSALLRRLPQHPVHERRPDFRNVNSVARKTADLATNRPGHPGRATNGGVPPPWLTPGEPADLMRLVLRQAAQARTA